jgi:hypothetical protein
MTAAPKVARIGTAGVLGALGAVFVAAATAGRINSSPYVFAPYAPKLVERDFAQRIRNAFGTASEPVVACVGRYPGTHGGINGFHEIHCLAKVTFLGAVSENIEAIYYIDAHKKQAEDKVIVPRH